MKVIVVEPKKAPKIVEIENTLEELQRVVDGYIECVYPYEDEVGLVCNEEGKINGMELNRPLVDDNGEIYDIVAGTFMVVGLTDSDFCSIDDVNGKDFSNKYMEMFKTPYEFLMINGHIHALPIED